MSGSCAEKSDESKIRIVSPAAGEPVRSVNGDRMDTGFPLAFRAGSVGDVWIVVGGSYGETQPISS
jgi:hypothetical protein